MEDCNVDSLDGHTEEDKTPVETNRKRKLKTPAQLEALEEYYEDHKYPTESMKSAIAEKIGLTEKQVSGWFCHRRLKDKRISKDEALGNGRMDRSSGVIQEHCSGPGQDSCGSTKPGEYKPADLREVESQWLAGQELSPKNLSHHNRLNTASLEVDMDDTSSESSLPLRPSHMPQRDAPQMWENSRYLIQNGDAMPSNPKVTIGAQLRRPSGYLKIKPKAEHPAIAAVKRQLGNSFREDGPPIGIEFHPLPIDAFQEAPKGTTTGPANGIGFLLPNISGSSYHVARSKAQLLIMGLRYQTHIIDPGHSNPLSLITSSLIVDGDHRQTQTKNTHRKLIVVSGTFLMEQSMAQRGCTFNLLPVITSAFMRRH
uniref:Homeobox domain-containing protein n=1 Tax=Kalanchoe fedtschenkoi TaxID=63787 RepID=A0A7N0UGG9_KALFE